ncbi:MAG TPA: hypothetical protein VGV61_16550 [Thermoanaerobaculia bacterium]|nr:hypothetical protein [Thermoanaerobaculia bacterium]
MKEDRKLLRPTSRHQWRAWLAKHHDAEPEIWLVLYKAHTGKQKVTYEDAVEEALCFGWIDTMVRRIDADTYMQRFSPRRSGGNWTPGNLERARRLEAAGLMTDAGRAKLPPGTRLAP